jgi:hypothetical protein
VPALEQKPATPDTVPGNVEDVLEVRMLSGAKWKDQVEVGIDVAKTCKINN